jgi:hypothetical protein
MLLLLSNTPSGNISDGGPKVSKGEKTVTIKLYSTVSKTKFMP